MHKANWICCKDDIGDCVPLYQRKFQIKKPIRRAYLYASARGVYEATLNGKRVGDFVLAPGWTSYQHRIQYQTYDITSLLSKENDLVVAVAAGWYKGGIARWWSYPDDHTCALIAKIEITYTDGSVENIATDPDWKAAKSGYSFCEIYDGFVFDARVTPDFSLETAVVPNNSKVELIPQIGEEIIEHERVKPQRLVITPKGERVIDFGQNLTGYVEIGFPFPLRKFWIATVIFITKTIVRQNVSISMCVRTASKASSRRLPFTAIAMSVWMNILPR